MHTFYRREFKAVLDAQISFLLEVYLNCCKTVQPIIECLGLNKDKPKLEKSVALASFFPEEMRPDPETLMSEVAVFRFFVEAKNKGFTLMSDIGHFANENKATFPLTAKAYRLALTASVRVAKNERSFSKLKLVKTINRSKMLDERLQRKLLQIKVERRSFSLGNTEVKTYCDGITFLKFNSSSVRFSSCFVIVVRFIFVCGFKCGVCLRALPKRGTTVN